MLREKIIKDLILAIYIIEIIEIIEIKTLKIKVIEILIGLVYSFKVLVK